MNALVNRSGAAVLAVVEEVSEPRWNSPSGARWEWSPDAKNLPAQYRDARLRVIEVTFESEEIQVTENDSVAISLAGSGDLKQEAPVVPTPNVGTTVFAVLERFTRVLSDGTTSTPVRVAGDYAGWWELEEESGTARSRDPERSVPLHALMDAVARERDRGLVEETPEVADSTSRNPLGGEVTPDVPSEGPAPELIEPTFLLGDISLARAGRWRVLIGGDESQPALRIERLEAGVGLSFVGRQGFTSKDGAPVDVNDMYLPSSDGAEWQRVLIGLTVTPDLNITVVDDAGMESQVQMIGTQGRLGDISVFAVAVESASRLSMAIVGDGEEHQLQIDDHPRPKQ